jgi:lipoprotein-releasing system permease protein
MTSFLRYFFRYMFLGKTKQPLILMTTSGLILSSFALLFLQSTMGGLQGKLIDRSKKVHGESLITFNYKDKSELKELYAFLDNKGIKYRSELTLELLIKSHGHYAPVIAHGLEKTHRTLNFAKANIDEGMLIGSDLASRLSLVPGEQVSLISPAHVDPFMGNIPRMSSFIIDGIVSTDVPEVDSLEAWVPILRLQGLIGERKINTIRLLSEGYNDLVKIFIQDKSELGLYFKSWEDSHSTLVWALNLETTVMVFLFSCMCLLVSLSISSGLMLFFDKIKRDLVSFWILGMDELSITASLSKLLFCLVTGSIVIGLVLSLGCLIVLDLYGANIMPDVFVDQKIPVIFSVKMFVVSFSIPFFISLFFSWFALQTFKKDIRYLDYVMAI